MSDEIGRRRNVAHNSYLASLGPSLCAVMTPCLCTAVAHPQLWYGLGRPEITSEIGNWSVFVLLGWRFVFGIIIKRDGREPHRQMPSRLWE